MLCRHYGAVMWIWLVLAWTCTQAEQPPCLLPEEDFFDQLAIQPGAPAAHREYRLCQLEASSSYEARLSFPGGAPFLFRLTLRAADLSPDRPDRPTVPTGSAGHQLPRARRQLADIEKAVFATDAAGRVVASGLANSAVPLLAVTSRTPCTRCRCQACAVLQCTSCGVCPLTCNVQGNSLCLVACSGAYCCIAFGVQWSTMLCRTTRSSATARRPSTSWWTGSNSDCCRAEYPLC